MRTLHNEVSDCVYHSNCQRHHRNSLDRRNRPGERTNSHITVILHKSLCPNKCSQRLRIYVSFGTTGSDGMDHNDYPVQAYSVMGHHCSSGPQTHWEEMCSCSSSTSQSSEDLNKPQRTHSQAYTPEGNPKNYHPPVVRLMPPNSTSAMGTEPGLDRGHSGRQLL